MINDALIQSSRPWPSLLFKARVLEHMAYNKRLKQLDLASLAGVCGSIVAVFSCLIGGCREDRADSFQRCTVTGQDATVKSCVVRAEIPIRPQEKDFSQGRPSNTGTGRPARFCSLHPWRYLKWTRDELWAAWSWLALFI